MGSLITHVVLVLVGIRLAMFCVVQWKLLRIKRIVALSRVSRWERFLLFSLPVIALLMAALIINSVIAIVRLLGSSAI